MGFFDELRKLTQPYDDEDDFFDGAETNLRPSSQQQPSAAQIQFESAFGEDSGVKIEPEDAPREEPAKPAVQPAAGGQGSSGGGLFGGFGFKKGGKARRERLVERLRARVAADPRLHVWALFDGAEMRAATEAGGRLRVGYTGGTGAHRADRMVCDYLRMRKILGLNNPVTVVTDDKDFAKEAAALGAAVKGTDTLDAQAQAN